jgi:hypothetical protein
MIVYDAERLQWEEEFDIRGTCNLHTLFKYLLRLHSQDTERAYWFGGLAYHKVVKKALDNMRSIKSHRQVVNELEENYADAFTNLKKAFCAKYHVVL